MHHGGNKLRQGIGLICGLLMVVLDIAPCFSLSTIEPILPIPDPPKAKTEKVNLGKHLYEDTLFSKDQSLSCYSCHSLKKGGTDNLSKYIGMNKKEGLLNTPTVLNASLNFRQFWDGRAKTLNDVIEDHIADPTVFANQWPTIIQRIKENTYLTSLFKNIYNSPPTPENSKDALTTYLKNLVTPNSPFDRFLKGDKSAISEDAKKGYLLFKNHGCITCHQGPNVGGNLYQHFGIYKDYFTTRGNITKPDLGLYNVTGKEEDKFVFKVPSLRNIVYTGYYLHDGSIVSLTDTINLMAIYQIGEPIPNQEIALITKFLESLSGVLPTVPQKEH